MLTVKMRGRKNHRMFSRRQSVSAPVFARVLLTLLIGAFLSACHPRVGDFVAPHLPDRDSKLFHGAGFLVEVIAGRSLKCADFQSRLWAGKTWDDFHVRSVFVPVLERRVVHYDQPTAGLLLIRSPPLRPLP
jgi:hypothetical protein